MKIITLTVILLAASFIAAELVLRDSKLVFSDSDSESELVLRDSKLVLRGYESVLSDSDTVLTRAAAYASVTEPTLLAVKTEFHLKSLIKCVHDLSEIKKDFYPAFIGIRFEYIIYSLVKCRIELKELKAKSK